MTTAALVFFPLPHTFHTRLNALVRLSRDPHSSWIYLIGITVQGSLEALPRPVTPVPLLPDAVKQANPMGNTRLTSIVLR